MRYVVIDANLLTIDFGIYLEHEDQAVITNAMVGDIAEKKDPLKVERFSREFISWYRKRASNIWVMRDLHDLVELEKSPDSPIDPMGWRDDACSVVIRKSFDLYGESTWSETMLKMTKHPEYVSFGRRKEAFLHITDCVARAFNENYPTDTTELRNNWDIIAPQMIREPRWGSFLLPTLGRTHPSTKWKEVLEVFPDKFAAGRASRINVWYGMMRAVGRTKKFENNYEDADHAIAASYTGYIATNDSRLKSTIRAVFPAVTVLEPTAPIGH